MTEDEIAQAIRTLARAVLELSKDGARAIEVDFETDVSRGIPLDDERELKRLAR